MKYKVVKVSKAIVKYDTYEIQFMPRYIEDILVFPNRFIAILNRVSKFVILSIMVKTLSIFNQHHS